MSEPDESFPSAFRRGSRGTVDIVADVLNLCRGWQKKTTVMYRANLSHQMLKFYMWHLVELGLLEGSDDMKFRTTQKGAEFLAHYQNLAQSIAGLAGASRQIPRNGVGWQGDLRVDR